MELSTKLKAMTTLERELETALSKALKKHEFTPHGHIWIKPVAGMANTYIAIELPTASATLSVETEVAYFTPIFRLVVDAGQIEPYLPEEITDSLLSFASRSWSELWVQRPYDFSDRIPTTIGVQATADINTVIERQVLGRLKIFEDHIDLHAWSISGLLNLALELIDGYVLSPLHWKSVMMVLAANGRDAREGLEHTAGIIDNYYGAEIGTAFMTLLDTLPMDRWKLWYLVGADEDIEEFRMPAVPRPGQIVPSRAGWRHQGMPSRAPSGKRVEAIFLNWPADDIEGWVNHSGGFLEDFLTRDIFFDVDARALNFADAMKLECQLLDTFADYAEFSQPRNFYLQTMYIRIFGEFYCHRVPDARWMQHPMDEWLHPGIELADGGVIDLFAICEQIFDKRNGMVLGEALPLGQY